MIYAQYLRNNGDDFQIAQVFRRDPVTGHPEADASTTAVKYHGLAGDGEFVV